MLLPRRLGVGHLGIKIIEDIDTSMTASSTKVILLLSREIHARYTVAAAPRIYPPNLFEDMQSKRKGVFSLRKNKHDSYTTAR